eukprot:40713-Eustigmatos_ZCMA.PRE.1
MEHATAYHDCQVDDVNRGPLFKGRGPMDAGIDRYLTDNDWFCLRLHTTSRVEVSQAACWACTHT